MMNCRGIAFGLAAVLAGGMGGVCAQTDIDAATVSAWSHKFRGWHYYPDYVIPPSPDDGAKLQSTDCPTVFQVPGKDGYYMWYTGFDGNGYQTFLAQSDDLVAWKPRGLVMSFGEKGSFDRGGVTFGGPLLESYDLDAPRLLKKHNGRYRVLYGCYAHQGGYEVRPGAEGLASSEDGFAWTRDSEHPILSIYGAEQWERDCIYQPWLLAHDGRFFDFYNAANGGTEQTGVAFSSDLLRWKRHDGNPIIRNGPKDSYDENFCSDPKVFRDGDHWVMIYFGVGKGGAHIMSAYSRDLLNWTKAPEPLYKAGGHPGGLDKQYAHKISLIYNPKNDTRYMFYNAVGVKGRAIGLLTSKPVK